MDSQQSLYQSPFEMGSKIQLSTTAQNRLDSTSTSPLSVQIDQNCIDQKKTIKNGSSIRTHTLKMQDTQQRETTLRALEQDPCVVGVGNALLMHKDQTSTAMKLDPDDKKAQHLDFLKQPEANAIFFDSQQGIQEDVIIAIIDDGVDLQHEDLMANIWTNQNEIPNNGIDDDTNGYVDDIHGYNFASNIGDPNPQTGVSGESIHGTHVAGLAAARYGNTKGAYGTAGQKVKLMVLNVFGKQAGAYSADIENAIRYAADQGAQVINMSLGGPGKSSTEEAAIVYALNKGVSIVTAAGNNGAKLSDTYFFSPGSYAEKYAGMINVGAIDISTNKKTNYSNYSPQYVEIAVPGSNNESKYDGLYSTLPNGKYGRLEGTSMAAPLVTGAVAMAIGLLKARFFQPTPKTVEEILKSSSIINPNLLSQIENGKVLSSLSLAQAIMSKTNGEENPSGPQFPLPDDSENDNEGPVPPPNSDCP